MAPPPRPRATVPVQVAAWGSGSSSSCLFDPPAWDYTQDLPDEILALVFASLSPADRSACSLACARWKEVDAATRHRLSLDARTELGHTYSPTKHARGSRGPRVAMEVRPP